MPEQQKSPPRGRRRSPLVQQTARGTRLWGFVFSADLSRLQRICDRYLNRDETGVVAYQPLAPFVLFAFEATAVAIGRRAPMRRLRRGDACSLTIWVPVHRRDSAAPMFFTPYAFSNDPLATIEGREMYGMPTEMGFLHQQDWPSCFDVDAYMVDRFDPKSVGRWGKVLGVERAGAPSRQECAWSDASEAAKALQQRLIERTSPAAQAAATVLGDFWPPHGSMVQLKQFPDCGDGRLACYSSIVEVESRITRILRSAFLGDDYRLDLPSVASHPLTADLGLRDGQQPVLGYELHCHVQLGKGREVWNAPRERVASPAPTLFDLASQMTLAPARRVVDFGAATLAKLVRSVLVPPPPANTPAPPPAAPLRRRRPQGREKIAILGGGVGAMAAAFELTSQPLWRKKYDITVYQVGWRLGGKGASGRNMDAASRRIQEHGLHAWFGFYDNAFDMMRRCYQEFDLGPGPAGDDPLLWGFQPHHEALIEEHVDGHWLHHRIPFPPNGERPGAIEADEPAVAQYARMVLRWLAWQLSLPESRTALGGASAPVERLVEASELGAWQSVVHFEPLADVFLAALDALIDAAWQELRGLLAGNDAARRLYVLVDLGLAIARGLLRDVAGRGFDAVEEDLCAWLRRHGATESTLDSDWVRVMYAMTFSFPRGDTENPQTAAGPAIRAILRMVFAYRGAFMWKMKGGMGDVIFAPLYAVLKKRGVKFKFFHRVTDLLPSDDGRSIERIDLGRQARCKRDYSPLVRVKDRWCWPDRPDLEQLWEGAEIAKVAAAKGVAVNFESAWSAWGPKRETPQQLRRGVDFDYVVLGISLGALGGICEKLTRLRPEWRQMVEKVATVRTQAFQLWLKPTLPQAGYDGPSPIMTAYVRPFDTWGDMTHTLAYEDWPPGAVPGQVAYFCGVMPDSDEPPPYADIRFPRLMDEAVFRAMKDFAVRHAAHLWPQACDATGLRSDALVAADDAVGEQRWRAQFVRANIDPSERYVLSLPGTTGARLRSDNSGFDNLVLAGDWTWNGLNLGCVEAAVMSGRRAAAAIAGVSPRIAGEPHLDAAPEERSAANA